MNIAKTELIVFVDAHTMRAQVSNAFFESISHQEAKSKFHTIEHAFFQSYSEFVPESEKLANLFNFGLHAKIPQAALKAFESQKRRVGWVNTIRIRYDQISLIKGILDIAISMDWEVSVICFFEHPTHFAANLSRLDQSSEIGSYLIWVKTLFYLLSIKEARVMIASLFNFQNAKAIHLNLW